MESIRVYADTSLFGGVFDEEFAAPSRRFFAQVNQGRFRLVVSRLVVDELVAAPETVRDLFAELRPKMRIAEITDEAKRLLNHYLMADVVSGKWNADALHVAIATVEKCDLIVSWNFRHIVHYEKSPRYNGVNVSQGYRELGIYSPLEVISDEQEEL